jgi:hypothetical protein
VPAGDDAASRVVAGSVTDASTSFTAAWSLYLAARSGSIEIVVSANGRS